MTEAEQAEYSWYIYMWLSVNVEYRIGNEPKNLT